MPQHELNTRQLALGVSTQPPWLRLTGQVADACNTLFSLVSGAGRRPGTTHLATMTSPAPTPGVDFRMHPIVRDAEERYFVVFGQDSGTIVRVFDSNDGTEATVTISSAAQAYLDLNNPEAAELFLATLIDFTLIGNKTIHVGTTFTPDYNASSEFGTVAQMKRNTPADATYHLIGADNYYQYDVSGLTFAKCQFPEMATDYASPTGHWDASESQGFSIRFQRQDITNTGLTLTTATLKLNKTAAFAGFDFRVGDEIELDGGTGVTPGFYEVVGKDSDDQIELGSDPGGTNPSDVSIVGISRSFGAQRNSGGVAEANMFEVARDIQDAFNRDDILVAWTETGAGTGHFTVTGPYRGSGAAFLETTALSGVTRDLQAASGPFEDSGHTATAGSGTVTTEQQTKAVDDRWKQVNEPGAVDAGIDQQRMPVKMIRTGLSPATFLVDVIDWNARLSGDRITNPTPDLWRKATSEGAISGITLASPGVITSVAHGLSNGDIVHISNADSTPVLDGARTVANVTADTFTVGVNTSGSGSAGNWTENAVPIEDGSFIDNRMILVGGDSTANSNSGDFFNYYKEDATNLVDSDRIDKHVSGSGVAQILFAVPHRKAVILFTRASGQFEMSGDGVFTPSSVVIDASTSISRVTVEPQKMGESLYFVSEQDNHSVLHEYAYSEDSLASVAPERSKHVEGFIPTGITMLATDPNTGTAIMGANDGMTLFVYGHYYDGNQIIQSAWSCYDFDDTYEIKDVVIVDGTAYVLVEASSIFTIESLPLSRPAIKSTSGGDAFPYAVHLDRMVTIQGTLDSGSITDITIASPGVVTSTSHGLTNGDTVEISGTNSTPVLDGVRTIANVTTHTYTVGVNTTGTGSAGTHERTVFDIGFKASGSTLNFMVYGPDFSVPGTEFIGGSAEVVGAAVGNGSWTYDGSAATTLNVPGDHTDGEVILGRFFDWHFTLTEPFVRQENGDPVLSVSLVLDNMIVRTQDSGPFEVKVEFSDGIRSDVIFEHGVAVATLEDGEFKAWAAGDLGGLTLTIQSDPDAVEPLTKGKARACNVVSVEFAVQPARSPV